MAAIGNSLYSFSNQNLLAKWLKKTQCCM